MADETPTPAARRLCSEIQLFDLCDLDSCRFKNGRFCSNEQLLARFEAIREEDERNTLLYDENEDDDGTDEDSGFDEADDSFDDEDF